MANDKVSSNVSSPPYPDAAGPQDEVRYERKRRRRTHKRQRQRIIKIVLIVAAHILAVLFLIWMWSVMTNESGKSVGAVRSAYTAISL